MNTDPCAAQLQAKANFSGLLRFYNPRVLHTATVLGMHYMFTLTRYQLADRSLIVGLFGKAAFKTHTAASVETQH